MFFHTTFFCLYIVCIVSILLYVVPRYMSHTTGLLCVCMCMYCMYVYVFFSMYFAQNVKVPFLRKETLPKCSGPQVK